MEVVIIWCPFCRYGHNPPECKQYPPVRSELQMAEDRLPLRRATDVLHERHARGKWLSAAELDALEF